MKKIKAVLSFAWWLVRFGCAMPLICIVIPSFVLYAGVIGFWEQAYNAWQHETDNILAELYDYVIERKNEFKQDYHGTTDKR